MASARSAPMERQTSSASAQAAKARDALLEARLLRFQRGGAQRRRMLDEVAGGIAEAVDGVVGEHFRTADQAPMLAAHGAPDQGAILESNSSTPRLVSMTSGPETLMRPCSETARAEQHAAIRPPPP